MIGRNAGGRGPRQAIESNSNARTWATTGHSNHSTCKRTWATAGNSKHSKYKADVGHDGPFNAIGMVRKIERKSERKRA